MLNSPKYGDAAAWQPRLAQGRTVLHRHAIEGYQGMPAKGGSNAPNDEVAAAVDYMLAAVQ